MNKSDFDKIQAIVDKEFAKLHLDSRDVGFEFEVMSTWDAIMTDLEELFFGRSDTFGIPSLDDEGGFDE